LNLILNLPSVLLLLFTRKINKNETN
jgi:hypothetical protein